MDRLLYKFLILLYLIYLLFIARGSPDMADSDVVNTDVAREVIECVFCCLQPTKI